MRGREGTALVGDPSASDCATATEGPHHAAVTLIAAAINRRINAVSLDVSRLSGMQSLPIESNRGRMRDQARIQLSEV